MSAFQKAECVKVTDRISFDDINANANEKELVKAQQFICTKCIFLFIWCLNVSCECNATDFEGAEVRFQLRCLFYPVIYVNRLVQDLN